MRITCPDCGAQYDVDDEDIDVEGQDVQCSDCLTIWTQDRDGRATNARPAETLAEGEAIDEPVEEPEFEGTPEVIEPEPFEPTYTEEPEAVDEVEPEEVLATDYIEPQIHDAIEDAEELTAEAELAANLASIKSVVTAAISGYSEPSTSDEDEDGEAEGDDTEAITTEIANNDDDFDLNLDAFLAETTAPEAVPTPQAPKEVEELGEVEVSEAENDDTEVVTTEMANNDDDFDLNLDAFLAETTTPEAVPTPQAPKEVEELGEVEVSEAENDDTEVVTTEIANNDDDDFDLNLDAFLTETTVPEAVPTPQAPKEVEELGEDDFNLDDIFAELEETPALETQEIIEGADDDIGTLSAESLTDVEEPEEEEFEDLGESHAEEVTEHDIYSLVATSLTDTEEPETEFENLGESRAEQSDTDDETINLYLVDPNEEDTVGIDEYQAPTPTPPIQSAPAEFEGFDESEFDTSEERPWETPTEEPADEVRDDDESLETATPEQEEELLDAPEEDADQDVETEEDEEENFGIFMPDLEDDTLEAEQEDADNDLTRILNEQIAIEDTLESPASGKASIADIPEELIGKRARVPDISALRTTLSVTRVPLDKEEEAIIKPIRRFRRGFVLMILLFVILGAIYFARDVISERFPQAAFPLAIYGEVVNGMRLKAEAISQAILDLFDRF